LKVTHCLGVTNMLCRLVSVVSRGWWKLVKAA
jgi:hypothetical protein